MNVQQLWIDLSVGFVLHSKVGDYVTKGDSLATIHANDRGKLETARERFLKAYTFSDTAVEQKPLIRDVIR